MNLMESSNKMKSNITARIAGVDMDIAVEGIFKMPDMPKENG